MEKMPLRLVAEHLEILHEWRAAGADRSVVAGRVICLAMNGAGRIFEMASAKAGQADGAFIIRFAQRRAA